MPNVYVKNSGSWSAAKEVFVKSGGSWLPSKAIYVKQSGSWVQVFPESTGTNTYTTGSGTFTVPNGIYSLTVSYPTPSAIVTTTLSVTPGQTLSYNIGGFGYASTFSTVTAPAYDTKVMGWASEVDGEDKMLVGVATAGGASFSGSGNASDLYNNAANAGCYYNEYYEWGHGDQTATIAITTVLTSTLLNSIQVVIKNFSGRGGAGVSVLTQPSSGNSYRADLNAYDGGYSQWYQTWDLYLQQVVPITVSW